MKKEAENRAMIISRMASRYPVLSDLIRKKMRAVLFKHNKLDKETLKEAAIKKAIEDQRREGLTDPINQESAEKWEARVREHIKQITDFVFAEHFSVNDAISIIDDVKFMNLHLQEMLDSEETSFELLKAAEKLKARGITEENGDPELELLKVNMIRTFISEQLEFIRIAKKYFTFNDLQEIKARIMGTGRIGGKAAGMLLAYSILKKVSADVPEVSDVSLPACYFVGSDVFSQFFQYNNALFFRVHKYKSLEDIEKEYPLVKEKIYNYQFPQEIVIKLRNLLLKFAGIPLIVRSSSLLEDNIQTSFAGKYESVFVVNNKSPEENLEELLKAIKTVYASVFSADAIGYRKEKNLLDYDEKMCVLIQNVVGSVKGDYYFPFVAGVGFSLNMFRWTEKIQPDDGMLRCVLGLGTRAVDRTGSDYPRIVPLTDPLLRPEKKVTEIKKYSQKYVDVINLKTHKPDIVPFREISSLMNVNELKLVAELDKGGYFDNSFFNLCETDRPVLTLNGFLSKTKFSKTYQTLLNVLSKHYKMHVDTEFAVKYDEETGNFRIYLLQCRPLSRKEDARHVEIPKVESNENVLFNLKGISPCGVVQGIKYIAYVSPKEYFAISDEKDRYTVAHIVGHLNRSLPEKQFILFGPGRWGTCDSKLGVRVGYADINNTAVLIELITTSGFSSDASYGTHFFLDLVEAKIFPLTVNLTDENTFFDNDFFEKSENLLGKILPEYKAYSHLVKVIDVEKEKDSMHLSLYMSLRKSKSIALFEPKEI